MTILRRLAPCIVALLLGASMAGAVAQQPNFIAGETKQQLAPGKTPGTFAFSSTNTVSFTQEPAFPVTVVITDDMKKDLATTVVADSKPFTISADLAPGGYWIDASVGAEKDNLYWSSARGQLFIEPNGLSTLTSSPLVLDKKMTVVSPDWKGALVTESRPLLRWQPLPGAARYQIHWIEEKAGAVDGPQGSATTADTQMRLPIDAVPERRYEWSVFAQDAQGEILGYWSAAYFYTPGGKEAFVKAHAEIHTGKKGTPYLGLSPVRFDGTNVVQGITVRNVMADSPALEAGLQPLDVLTSFNGTSLDKTTVREFVEMIRAQPLGSVVKVEFLRNGEKKSANITVGAMP